MICSYAPLCVPSWRQWRRKAQTPMMHLSSLFCFVKAVCGFVCLSRSSQLVASVARSYSLLSFYLKPFGLSLTLSESFGTAAHFFLQIFFISCLLLTSLTSNLPLHLLIRFLPLAPVLKMSHRSLLVFFCDSYSPLSFFWSPTLYPPSFPASPFS